MLRGVCMGGLSSTYHRTFWSLATINRCREPFEVEALWIILTWVKPVSLKNDMWKINQTTWQFTNYGRQIVANWWNTCTLESLTILFSVDLYWHNYFWWIVFFVICVYLFWQCYCISCTCGVFEHDIENIQLTWERPDKFTCLREKF